MSVALEQLADGSPSDRNFQRLAALVLDTGGQSIGIRFGSDTATFTASGTSATVTVNHGLGRTPRAAFIQETTGSTRFEVTARNDTSITVIGYVTTGSAATATVGFYWFVVG